MNTLRIVGWTVVALVLMALAVPWFLWGSTQTAADLPVWLWWHIGWMLLASVVFAVFTRTDWGLGVEEVTPRG
jgi:hypothetical protein